MEKIKTAYKQINRHERYLKEKDAKGNLTHYGIVPPVSQTADFSLMELIELKLALEELSADERYIVRRSLMENASLNDIAGELKVSKLTVLRRKKRAIVKLKHNLE